MDAITNPFQACIKIFLKPSLVFDTINQKDNWSWIPFLFSMAFVFIPVFWYFNFVDFDWYVDFVINASAGDLSPAEQDNMRALMNQSVLMYGSLTFIVIYQLGINALLAIYLHLATKSDENNLNGFTDWYGFTWWVTLPSVISFIASVLVIAFAASNQISLAAVNPLALSYWLGLDDTSDWFGITNMVRPDFFLSLYLIAVGVSRWTSFESKKVYAVTLTPFAIIFTLWTLLLIF
ncbi:YIP1 family protein [Aliiglaciecola sp. M165]|uniref:YIP1 family protein n=1 Tax=Aliiglaciecola sp. M165 TaxID=2593649 RepID=UPI00117EAEF0|nr:YIP1 family protein [Aliiglaciecola sp. M165]TRY29361.1 YIP1 family protein [Aliiglaciecola sp. M165]